MTQFQTPFLIVLLVLKLCKTLLDTTKLYNSDNGDNTKQKRAYQILCTILEGCTDSHVAFVAEHLEELYKQVRTSIRRREITF